MGRDLSSAVWFREVATETNVVDPFVAGEPNSALVHRLREGDGAALEMLYRQHHEAVRAFARRLLGNADIAEDLVHDVFLSAPAAFQNYRGESTLRTFLISVAVNKARHFVRSASRRSRMLERLAIEPERAPHPGPDAAVQRRQLAHELQRALDQLSLDERIIVVLCEVEERTSSEVAAIVRTPEATVRTRLFRAKRKLRALLDPGAAREQASEAS
ncbi:MAG: RNA polymerase sigma factor [Polyangiaceae bacterium]|nr:RNA polymerase sigma factor [Polyangiaceae bacterium]